MQLTVIGARPPGQTRAAPSPATSSRATAGSSSTAAPECSARLRAADGGWPRVDAVVITHFHLDHWGDLVPWIFGANFGPGRDDPEAGALAAPGGNRPAPRVRRGDELRRAHRRRLRLQEYEGGTPFRAAGFEVMPFELDHYSELTFGLRVTNHGARSRTRATPARARSSSSLRVRPTSSSARPPSATPEPAERGHLSEARRSRPSAPPARGGSSSSTARRSCRSTRRSSAPRTETY